MKMTIKNRVSIPRKWPHVVKVGSVSVKISRVKLRSPQKGFTYKVYWSEKPKKWEDVRRVKFEDALTIAMEKAEYLNSARRAADRLRLNEKEAYILAQDIVGNTPIVEVAREWKLANKYTRGQVVAAAKAWHDQHQHVIELLDVNETVRRFREAKEKSGYSWKKNYQKSIPRFQKDFGDKVITTITSRQIGEWLNRNFANSSYRNTIQSKLSVLWCWARDLGYLPRNVKTEVELIKPAKETTPERGIISPTTFRELLFLIRDHHLHYLPVIVLSGFCGLRTDEVENQKWKDVFLDHKKIGVTKAKAGTPSYRHVSICDEAIEWLIVCPKRKDGNICTKRAMERVRGIARENAISLPKNCLRHSFISYHVVLNEMKDTENEAGTSARQIHKHYREIVDK
ncbi:MAG: hypothetical protein O7C75_20525, partial [Verrucomicrobia bacterium]|nr:hypothetical protein [Verrucomicrobiota bacterium]